MAEMSQDEIDALFGPSGGDSKPEPAAPSGGSASQNDIDSMFDNAQNDAPATNPNEPTSQGDIDALFDGGGGGLATNIESDGSMGQEGIDALFDGGGSAEPELKTNTSGTVSQDSIDDLFDQAGSGGSPAPSTGSGDVASQSGVDDLFANVQASPDAFDDSKLQAPPASGPTSQGDIDSMFDQASAGAGVGQIAVEDGPEMEEERQMQAAAKFAESSSKIAPTSGMDLGGLTGGDPSQVSPGNVQNVLDMVEQQTGGGDAGGDVEEAPNLDVNFLLEMPLTVTFEVGRAKMSISDLLSLGQGSVLELHRLVGEDLDVFVNGKLVARGEVVVYKEKFGARVTEIIPPADRVKRMGGMDRYR